ncbi:transglycosylase SLT domain-containing protein [Patescibacteria group bacterium]
MPDQKILQDLKDKRDSLISKFKKEHPDIYTWLLENQLSIQDLGRYSANIASALALTLVTSKKVDTIAQKGLTPHVKVIEREELYGLDDEEKGKLVWQRYGHIIERVAKKYDIDPGLIFATIMIESGGNTYAIRHEPSIGDSSYGLGQILYGTAVLLEYDGTPAQLFDPEVNIELIGRYHKRNIKVYGNLTPQQLTIAYNTGTPYNQPHPGHLDKFNRWFNKVREFIG